MHIKYTKCYQCFTCFFPDLFHLLKGAEPYITIINIAMSISDIPYDSTWCKVHVLYNKIECILLSTFALISVNFFGFSLLYMYAGHWKIT